MASHTAAGSLLKICAAQPATYDAAGYAALSWTTVAEITNFGEFDRVYNLIKHNPVATRGTVKRKGSYDEGQMNLEMALDNDDAGQIIMKAASRSDSDYSIQVYDSADNQPYYFQAQVMSFRRSIGGVDNIVKAMSQLELTTSSAGVGIVEG